MVEVARRSCGWQGGLASAFDAKRHRVNLQSAPEGRQHAVMRESLARIGRQWQVFRGQRCGRGASRERLGHTPTQDDKLPAEMKDLCLSFAEGLEHDMSGDVAFNRDLDPSRFCKAFYTGPVEVVAQARRAKAEEERKARQRFRLGGSTKTTTRRQPAVGPQPCPHATGRTSPHMFAPRRIPLVLCQPARPN